MYDYDYLEAVKDDVREYIEYDVDLEEYKGKRDKLEQELNDDLWTVDSVTGNGSGSYTFDRRQAAEYLVGNLDLLAEAVEEFGGDMDVLKNGAEACDVTIRCYLLGQAIGEVLDEYEANGAFEEEDEVEESFSRKRKVNEEEEKKFKPGIPGLKRI